MVTSKATQFIGGKIKAYLGTTDDKDRRIDAVTLSDFGFILGPLRERTVSGY
jgi:hypothetical protein